jgi:hypothetical protein
MQLKTAGLEVNPLPSVWGKTLIFRWLYPRKLVNLSESDGRALMSFLSSLTELNLLCLALCSSSRGMTIL